MIAKLQKIENLEKEKDSSLAVFLYA